MTDDNNSNDNVCIAYVDDLHNFPNLCIPRVNTFVTKEQVFEIINKYSFGSIEKIDVIKKRGVNKNNDYSNMVFIYFNKWNDNALAKSVKNRLMSGKDIKIIYDDPWYWKISAIKV
uniref:RRM domain-containing protein n=1 Tax=viral metagenome TaxID=1070528 RepID=A0A6C0DH62_9ZZZZ